MIEEGNNRVSKTIRRQIFLMALFLGVGIISLLGASYALFSVSQKGNKKVQIVVSETPYAIALAEKERIQLPNITTMSEEEASQLKPYEFTISNQGSVDAYYSVSILENQTKDTIDKEYLGYSLEGDDGTSIHGTLDDLGENMAVVRNKRIKSKEEVNYALRIWLTEEAPNSEMGKTYESKIGVDSMQALPTFADYLIEKANEEGTSYINGNTKELYTYNEEATEDTSRLISYRYLGNEPNNYILFNNEVWRIIGVFQTEKEGYAPQVKIIKEEALLGSYGSNNKNPSFLLSTDYYDKFESLSHSISMKTDYSLSHINIQQLNGNEIYKMEHNHKVKTFQSFVGLPYLSDYVKTFGSGYQDFCFENITSCSTKSWMSHEKMAFLNGISATNEEVWTTDESGKVVSSLTSETFHIHPVVYLYASTFYQSGNGSQSNPYRIGV